ncbi:MULTISPECIES: hypothetical protein [unclassified Streptomyces]|uniref:hypothetical protein n=1 Tax=unclassified Streptomyces TaxID=2593676 RepID=UPI00215243E8|nr:hypothetical protein [Streptomyces sp. CB02959]
MPHPSDRPVARLLPWAGPDGQSCYLLTDRAGAGRVSRYADQIEEVHLSMGLGLLEHAEPLIDDPAADAGQLRFLSAQLSTALRDAVRVAESRGDLLAEYRRHGGAEGARHADGPAARRRAGVPDGTGEAERNGGEGGSGRAS